jgi:threonyl-tRNA synthetase
MKITFPDNSSKEYQAGITAAEIAKGISQGLAKKALAAKLGDALIDLNRPIEHDGGLKIITFDDEEGKLVFWHSSAHLMASAILRLFPNTKLAIGPAVPDDFAARFYYDLDLEHKLTEKDLEAIEAEMAKIVSEDKPFVRSAKPRQDAMTEFRGDNDPYKAEIAGDLEGDTVTFYTHGDFKDMCRGPHVPSTGKIKAFKLLSVAGAYWRGDEKNKMLQRIYGVSFPEKQLLTEHLEKIEQAKLRDHRLLGKSLDLFSINDEVGPGLVLWHPKGALIRHIIEAFWKDAHIANGYELVYTPHIARLDLWAKSGHLGFYKDNMFKPIEIENQNYQLKPMNCPFHIQIYKARKHSYRELPFRWAELGTVYRYERSGVLHGLPRVRGFTQDDAHVFCRPDQLQDELIGLLNFNLFFLKTFGFDNYDTYLSTRPEHSVGSDENWAKATEALKNALEKRGLPYQIDPGEGVFYGPKIDVKIKDNLGRSWQCTTIQVDFNLPEQFDVTYTAEDGAEHRAIMIHRALLGSLERFFGIIIEQYGGSFPVWLAPTQVIVLPVVDDVNDYADHVAQMFKGAGIRVETDKRNQKIGYKIREAENQKIPYMVIVGKKEETDHTISVRRHKLGDIGVVAVETVSAEILQKIKTKSLD